MSRITKSLVSHCPEWPVSIKLDNFSNSQKNRKKIDISLVYSQKTGTSLLFDCFYFIAVVWKRCHIYENKGKIPKCMPLFTFSKDSHQTVLESLPGRLWQDIIWHSLKFHRHKNPQKRPKKFRKPKYWNWRCALNMLIIFPLATVTKNNSTNIKMNGLRTLFDRWSRPETGSKFIS